MFLPNDDMLVSEKHVGRLRRAVTDGTLSPSIDGLPLIFSEGNGGLLGLALNPEFEANPRVYFAYYELGEDGRADLSVRRAGKHVRMFRRTEELPAPARTPCRLLLGQAFRIPRCTTQAARRRHEQSGRVLTELNIEIPCANSGQAKDRVERVSRTLQDRLVKELRIKRVP